MNPTLFDRFESNPPTAEDAFARDLADMLSGRSVLPDRRYGILSWGMPHMTHITSKSDHNREMVASYIASTLAEFEPRLEGVRVTPISGTFDFSFHIEARDSGPEARGVAIRVLSPVVGGGLGAEVVVIDQRGPGGGFG